MEPKISRRTLFKMLPLLALALFFGWAPGVKAVIDKKLREAIVARYIMTPTGRTRLAMAMIAPLRRNLDYTSIGRKAFLIEQLPTGALSTYDRS